MRGDEKEIAHAANAEVLPHTGQAWIIGMKPFGSADKKVEFAVEDEIVCDSQGCECSPVFGGGVETREIYYRIYYGLLVGAIRHAPRPTKETIDDADEKGKTAARGGDDQWFIYNRRHGASMLKLES